jgi:uroporphyrinogen-III synthase
MITPLPLQNKKVLVPRETKHAKSFSEMVHKYGGTPVEIPLLAFKPIGLTTEIQRVIHNLNQYDWIVFTSNVTVDTFFSFSKEVITPFPKIATIGTKTAKELVERGLYVEFIPTEFVAETFVTEFLPLVQEGTRVLIPKGNLARSFISEGLKRIGAIVDEVIVYETYFPLESKSVLTQSIMQHELDVIPFTSPSTVDHFMEVIRENGLSDELSTFTFACIGPVAKKRAESYGLNVKIVPPVYTVEEMVKSIANYINKNKK